MSEEQLEEDLVSSAAMVQQRWKILGHVSPEQFGAEGLWFLLHGLLRLAGVPGSGEQVPAPPCA